MAVLLCLLAVILYLSAALAVGALFLSIAMLFITSFERQREYLADWFAAYLLGPRPVQMALARMDLFSITIEDDTASQPDPQGVSAAVEEIVAHASRCAPTFKPSLRPAEFANTHPLTGKRIYYLEHPEERTGIATRLMTLPLSMAARVFPEARDPQFSVAGQAMVAGGATGLLMIATLIVLPPVWAVLLSACACAVCGIALGLHGAKSRWTASLFTESVLIASFSAGTAVLVVGIILLNTMALAFPLCSIGVFGTAFATGIATVAVKGAVSPS
ncbi:MAG: M48 family metalloprotease [Planctomycetota bacterium]